MKIKNWISNSYLKAGVAASLVLSSTAFSADGSQQALNVSDTLLKQIDTDQIKAVILGIAGLMFGVTVLVVAVKKARQMFNAS
ncbi:hypothetical protein [Xenorhabdus bovienii]|uniref:hypothetical protein n=1 Tax=Xenorhabdus bovienii TaxID=40576 RepID=UPI0023B296E6|nr:hypothetical protein [Xenorhabdus bovienii]MDE9460833.1 hypothetical protein [Xenorhabdus bovienii]MDE9468119.1 hypothetical protein [Xenorhabdus bovienii]